MAPGARRAAPGPRAEVLVFDTALRRDPAELAAWEGWLDDDERRRLSRLRFESDRHVFLVSHALLRGALGRAVGADARELRFVRGEHGKPALDPDWLGSREAPAFNLSHSGTFGAVAICHGTGEVGVDIEQHRPGRRFGALARRNFAAAEVRDLEALPEAERPSHFYDVWTLKEAYLKARGTGLQLPLAGFRFRFDDGALGFGARGSVDPLPGRWRFWCWRLGEGFSLSLALDPGGPGPVDGPRCSRLLPGEDPVALDARPLAATRW